MRTHTITRTPTRTDDRSSHAFARGDRPPLRLALLERLAAAVGDLAEVALGGRMLRHQLLDLGQPAIELRVAAAGDVLRQVLDLDVGDDAAVLGAPALRRIPERELGLGRHASVD